MRPGHDPFIETPGAPLVVRRGRAALLLALLAACTTQPIVPLPEPYAAGGEWLSARETRAFIGLKTEENDSGSLEALFFEPGVRVVRVVEGSPAASAGLRVGDVVLQLGDVDVDTPDSLDALVDSAPPGETLHLRVRRDDTVFDVPLVARIEGKGEGSAKPVAVVDPSRSRATWATAPGGVRLVSAHEKAPPRLAGLTPGDIVTALDGQPVHAADAFVRRLSTRAPGSTVLLDRRGRDSLTMTLLESPTRLTGFHLPILWSWDASLDGKRSSLDIVDIWVLALFRFERSGHERTWKILSFPGFAVLEWSAGVGELDS